MFSSALSYVSSFVWTPVSDAASLSSSASLPSDMRFVFASSVRTEADRLYRQITAQAERGHSASADYIIPFSQLIAPAESKTVGRSSVDDLELLFRQLCVDGKAVDYSPPKQTTGATATASTGKSSHHHHNTQRIIKFLRPGSKERIQPLTPFEASIGEMKHALARTAIDITHLEAQITAKTLEAKAALKASKRPVALSALARRKSTNRIPLPPSPVLC